MLESKINNLRPININKRKNKKFGLTPAKTTRINRGPFTSYCVAKEYDLDKLAGFLNGRMFTYQDYVIGCKCVREFNEQFDLDDLGLYKFIDPKDSTHNTEIENYCYIFWFSYGSVVFWNMTEMEEKSIIEQTKQFEIDPNELERDSIEYEEVKIFEEAPFDSKSYISKEILRLCSNDFSEKFSVSFALAQSVKVAYFEGDIDEIIDEVRGLALELESKGRLDIDKYSLKKKIGQLYLKKSELNFDTDILETPSHFWLNSKYESHFGSIKKYLELEQRTIILNKRLSIITELLKVLNEEVNFNHFTKLHMILIGALVINVLMLLFWDVLIKDTLNYFSYDPLV